MQKIPLELLELQGDGYHILIDVCLFDQPFKMVLDTGASKTVLDKTTLLQSGIPEEKIENTNIISTGLGTNSMESFILELPTLAIGNWKIKKFITARSEERRVGKECRYRRTTYSEYVREVK